MKKDSPQSRIINNLPKSTGQIINPLFTSKGNVCIVITIVFVMLIHPDSLLAQKDYKKNSHVSISSVKQGKYFKVNYAFKDQWDILREFSVKFPVKATNKAIDRFGVPENFLEPYPNTESVLMERDRLMKRGMFYLDDNILKVDKSAVVNFYSETYGKPIAENIIRLLRQEKQDTRRNRIEFTMKFIQDIPYGIPEAKAKHKFNGGIFVPPQVLIKRYGDCDSKTLLLVSILVHLINPDDIVFLGQKGHVLSGIKMKEVSGMTYYTYRGDHYAIAETAGPARRSLGERGPDDQNTSVIETLDYTGNFIYDPPVNENNSSQQVTDRYAANHPANKRILATANDCIRIKARNEYQKPVRLLVEFMNPKGNWQTGGWYQISPGQELLVALTNNKYFYYYAVSDDVEWTGEKLMEFEGELLRFAEVCIEQENSSEFRIVLSNRL